MRNTIRHIRNFALYLPPIFLLGTAGALLLALLYYPTLSTPVSNGPQTAMVTDANQWRVHAEDLFVVMLADALRQLQEEQGGHVRTLMYRYDRPAAECQPFSRPIPLWIETGGNSGHPVLIRI